MPKLVDRRYYTQYQLFKTFTNWFRGKPCISLAVPHKQRKTTFTTRLSIEMRFYFKENPPLKGVK